MKQFKLAYLLCSFCIGMSLFAANTFSLRNVKVDKETIPVNVSYSETTVIKPFESSSPIYGLCITGRYIKQSNDYLVRVILADNDGHEYCVMEAYNMINADSELQFKDYCEETAILNGVVPECIRIILYHATMELESLSVVLKENEGLRNTTYEAERAAIKKAQVSSRIDKINSYNIANGKLWIAGETPLSTMDYESKRRILGFPENVSTGGYEYYLDGFFQVGESISNTRSTPSPYIDHFDWRDRHGKCWVTSVKNQMHSNYCFAFSTVACLESMYMLYFNDSTAIDLSDQEAAVCSHLPTDSVYTKGGYEENVLEYMRNIGVCDEYSYPFQDIDSLDQICLSDSINPQETVRIYGRDYIYTDRAYDDSIKHRLIHYGPLISGYHWRDYQNIYNGHSMLLVGYDTISHSDIVRLHTQYGLQPPNSVTDNLIGKTYWIFKNSWGPNGDAYLGGYQHIVFNDIPYYNHNALMNTVYNIKVPISSSSKSDSDIVWEDADGDGYYFWGIGPKPAHCPSWVPNEPDGDDSNPEFGPMDSYGDLMRLYADNRDTIYIDTNLSTISPRNYVNHIVVRNNSNWTVRNHLSFYGGAIITIKAGSSLSVTSGGFLDNTILILEPGAALAISEDGKIRLHEGTELYVPIGVVANISYGSIF